MLDFEFTCRYSFRCPPWLDRRRLLWHGAANHPDALCCLLRSTPPWNAGNGRPPSPRGWCAGGKLSSSWRLGPPNPTWLRWSEFNGRWSASGPNAFWRSAWRGSQTPLAAVPRAVFPPEVAIHVVRLACERPDLLGRSLSPWDGTELARPLIAEGIVSGISAATVRRILVCHHLKPWRHHLWLYPKKPRDEAFYATISELIDLYTRPLHDDEIVLSVDENTSLQPRGPLNSGTFRAAMRMNTSAAGPCTCLRHSTLVREQSLGHVTPASVSRNSSPFWNSWMRRLTTTSTRFISYAILSARITAKKSSTGR